MTPKEVVLGEGQLMSPKISQSKPRRFVGLIDRETGDWTVDIVPEDAGGKFGRLVFLVDEDQTYPKGWH